MDAAEIIHLLEKPTKNRWPFMYNIRDKATISDIVAALQASTIPLTRRLLCSIVSLRFRVGYFEKGFSDATQAVPALIEALADPDEGVRSAAIEALWDIGDPAAGPALLEQYHKEKEGSPVRHMLASALGASHYTPAIPTLIQALSSSDDMLRRDATWGLRSLQAQEAKESLQKALTSETDPSTIQVIEETLQELEGPPEKFTLEAKIGRLIAQIKNGETAEREAAATALGDIVNEQVLPPVLALLNDEQSHVRRDAAEMLSWLRDERAIDALLRALQDQDREVREWAIEALWELCEGKGDDLSAGVSEKMREPLLQALQDEDSEVRESASNILHWLDIVPPIRQKS